MQGATLAEPPAAGSRSAASRSADTDANPANIRHLVVLGHPAPGSFNHAVAQAYCDAVRACGQVPILRDLYALGFDPLLKADERPGVPGYRIAADARAELEFVRGCRAITLVYPIWFGMPPAVITGYVARVLGAGLTGKAIREGEQHETLAGRLLVLLTTSGSTLPWLAERGQWLGLRDAFDFYLETIFSFAGTSHDHFDSIVTPLSRNYAEECLERARERARLTCSALLAAAHERQKRAKLSLWPAETADS